jgi:hypothetical protein
MTGSRHAIVLGIGLFALALAGAARAQDLSAGKTPAQLFQLNCALCHKSPRGLAAAGADKGPFSGLEDFLAEHYTADPKSAAIIAAYLTSVGGAAPAHTGRHRDAARAHKPKAKAEAAKNTDKSPDKKSENSDKTKAETSTKPEGGQANAEEPKAEKPATSKPAVTAADKKKPASPSTQAKDGKSAAGEKKTD